MKDDISTTLPLPGRQRLRGMLNLNDPGWGRRDDEAKNGDKPSAQPDHPDSAAPEEQPESRPRPEQAWPPKSSDHNRGNQGPPDLDELWQDFNRKLGNLLGGRQRGGQRPTPPRGPGGPGGGGSGGPGFKMPGLKNAGYGLLLLIVAACLVWMASGIYIVQEGEQAVITRFGRYTQTVVNSGLHWRWPAPIERSENVRVTQIRSVDVGGDSVRSSTGLRDSAMLTRDENIVELKFAVQYRLKNPSNYLFESRTPDRAVSQVAESAVREVVGKMDMDDVLSGERDQIAPRVRQLMQSNLDRYKVGVDVVAVNLKQGGVNPPKEVIAAFDDVLKADQDRERVKNQAQAYANDVIPRAVGTAARLVQQAEGYKAQVVARAEGDSRRFLSVLDEYRKAPQVTRERMYIDGMEKLYSGAKKVLVDGSGNNNLLYLPLDKLMSQSESGAGSATNAASSSAPLVPPLLGDAGKIESGDSARDPSSARQRQGR